MSTAAAATPAATTATPAPTAKRDKVCDFYLTRGCVKGDDCDHLHPKAPDGTVTTQLSAIASSRAVLVALA